MNFEKPQPLLNRIEVRAINRPIRIAYLIPYEEIERNHWIIDAVFYECYTRWSGGRTLIIPSGDSQFLHEEYDHWLEFYDPDFIYSYLELKKEFIEKINAITTPIAFIKHTNRRAEEARWSDYSPDWNRYFKAVSSLTTIDSPYPEYPRLAWIAQKEITPIPTLITQYGEVDKHRFIPDNFGVAFDPINYPNPINGRFNTLCFTPNTVSERTIVGTSRSTSITEILSQIRCNKALPISRLAIAHSKSVPLVMPYSWARQFNLFIGHTCLDRIHFWNARNLCPDPGALLVNQEQLQNVDFIKEIGQFLNNHNFLGQHNGPAQVAIRSFTHSKEELSSMGDSLRKSTFNNIFLNDRYNAAALPIEADFGNYQGTRSPDVTTFKLSEDINELQAKEPEHFTFIPKRFQSFDRGQWIVELEIARHKNLSKYSNVVDTWMLPRRHSVVRAFTKNLARVSKDHLLALLPSTDNFPFMNESIKNTFSYQLLLPDDEDFFRCLVLGDQYLLKEDLRSMLDPNSYKDMAVSDKGQNLRGVISMFDHHSEAAEILTNRYWRYVLRTWKGNKPDKDKDENNKDDNNKFYNLNHFKGRLTNNRESKKMLMSKLRLRSQKDVNKYLEANLIDTLEFLIRKRVFFRVYQWRCSYCGHANTRTFEDMNETNNCSICSKTHFTPIDIEWKYELNNFIFRSLCERNGLTVLWALGQLHENIIVDNSFYYLPEVDLYPEYKIRETKNEIDLLCIIGGRFYAVEVKLSAISFIEKQDEINKFIEEIKLIRPDVALLVFEQYCESETDVENTKVELKKAVERISESVGKYIKVKTLIASDFSEFINHPVDLGYWGKRVSKLFDKIDDKKEI